MISGRNGFTLMETLISLVIITLTAVIAFTPTKTVLNALGFVKSYFSEEKPADSRIYVYQMIDSIAESLMKQGFGNSIPDLNGTLDATDASLEISSDVEVYRYGGKKVLEVIKIVGTYTNFMGKKVRIEKKVVRGRF